MTKSFDTRTGFLTADSVDMILRGTFRAWDARDVLSNAKPLARGFGEALLDASVLPEPSTGVIRSIPRQS